MKTYREVQRFTDSWFGKVLTAGILLFVAFMCFNFLADPSWGIFFSILPASLGFIILVGSTLLTEIDSTGIHYQFKPFHRRRRTISWDQIEGVIVRQYSPLREFGGWGIRFSGSGKAFNTAGNKGIQMVLKNRKQILIGTQHELLVEDALKKHRSN